MISPNYLFESEFILYKYMYWKYWIYGDLINCINTILLQSTDTRIIIKIFVYLLQVQCTVYYDWRNSSIDLSFEKKCIAVIKYANNSFCVWNKL